MTEIPKALRQLALSPFTQLPAIAGMEIVDGSYVSAALHKLPMAQVITPHSKLQPQDLEASIEEARALVRTRDRDLAMWWLGRNPGLADALVDHGLRNEDSPGFEKLETVMVLLQAPAGDVPGDVEVSVYDGFESFAAGQRVQAAAFEFPEALVAAMEAQLEQDYADYVTPGNPYKGLLAKIDGRPVGMAGASFWPPGVNLFGGAVLPEARGRGVYRALTHARWRIAVEHGTPALIIQAGRMSKPIAEALGFRQIAAIPTFVDTF